MTPANSKSLLAFIFDQMEMKMSMNTNISVTELDYSNRVLVKATYTKQKMPQN